MKNKYGTGSKGNYELENQFILRLPPGPSKTVKDLLNSDKSSTIKDRLNIQLDHTNDKDDLRNGIVTVDTTMYKCRLMDMPTIIESWKTIDNKSFYKTADICQMLVVREGEDPPEDEESKKKKKDAISRVDKKYLYPHGYTAPLKSVRKRRFRKMLRKKNLELPEIEKEVKRLLRADEEATSVKWEVLREDEDGKATKTKGVNVNDTRAPANLDEQLFGTMVSSSEDEGGPSMPLEDDEDSRISAGDSRLSGLTDLNTSSPGASKQPPHLKIPKPQSNNSQAAARYITEFNPSMFGQAGASAGNALPPDTEAFQGQRGQEMFEDFEDSSNLMRGSSGLGFDNASSALEASDSDSNTLHSNSMSRQLYDDGSEVARQLQALAQDLDTLKRDRSNTQSHIDTLDNLALKSRFSGKLLEIDAAIAAKENQMAHLQ